MANWKYHLDVSDLWNAFHNKEIDAPNLSKKVALRLQSLPLIGESAVQMRKLIKQLNKIKTVEEFDNIWSKVYDLADSQYSPSCKLLWIKTTI